MGRRKEGIVIDVDVWGELLLFARCVYKMNPEADLYDWLDKYRQKFLGGIPYSESLLDRVDREVATELDGPRKSNH